MMRFRSAFHLRMWTCFARLGRRDQRVENSSSRIGHSRRTRVFVASEEASRGTSVVAHREQR